MGCLQHDKFGRGGLGDLGNERIKLYRKIKHIKAWSGVLTVGQDYGVIYGIAWWGIAPPVRSRLCPTE